MLTTLPVGYRFILNIWPWHNDSHNATTEIKIVFLQNDCEIFPWEACRVIGASPGEETGAILEIPDAL